jgi:snRNA-activating protein complex subunit 3
LQAIEASQPKQKEKKRKRGRPYDRDVRAAEVEMDAAAIQREEILTRMKQEREAAKQSSNLHSLRFKQEREAADAGNKNQLRKLRFLTTAIKFPTTTTPEVTEEEAVESTEIVLVVELYHGLKKHTKTQEFLVLGSQPLTALRDRLYCLTDELAQEAKLNVPSGYFLIEDVFYNDMRNPKAIDYSEPIIKWTRETKEATERWKAVGGAGGGRKSFGTTNQNSDSVSLPSFR